VQVNANTTCFWEVLLVVDSVDGAVGIRPAITGVSYNKSLNLSPSFYPQLRLSSEPQPRQEIVFGGAS
jgi:hypothetical protein